MKKLALVVGAFATALVLSSCATHTAQPAPAANTVPTPVVVKHHHHHHHVDYKGEAAK